MVFFKKIFIYFSDKLTQCHWRQWVIPSPFLKVPQLLSNLFIIVVVNNGGLFFHSSSRVPWFSSNLINVVDTIGQKGGDTHSITIFFELLSIVYESDFVNKIFRIILVPSSHFPLLSQFHYPSLLNDIQVWNINIWTKKENGSSK